MATKKLIVSVSVSLPYDTLCEIDEIVKENELDSRSAFILESVKKSIREKRAN